MSRQTSSTGSRYGWRWFLVLIGGLSWVSIGCNPQSLSMLLMPFNGDNSVEPEYKLFAKDKEITLAILSNFARPEIHPDLQAADAELAEQVASAFRKRCAENKNKIKIVPYAQVRSQQLKQQLAGGDSSPVEIGKNLKAEYVLDLTINSFSLYEKNYHPPMYRGNANIAVNLYKVEVKDDVHKVFGKEYPRIFPGGSGPIDASSMSPSLFRGTFLLNVANDISKMFLAYSPDENHRME
jgi:hypothetical protein